VVTGGGNRPVGEQLGDDLDRHPGTDQFSGPCMTQQVRGEHDPGRFAQPCDKLGDRLVAQRPTHQLGPQVHEDVVGIDVAELGVHVGAVETHQRRRDRHRHARAGLGPSAVDVVVARDDRHLTTVGDEVGVAQPERLADPHPRLGQQREQEPITQPHASREDRGDLLDGERPRQPPWRLELDRPGRDRPARRDMVQERPVGAARDPPPGHQALSELHPGTGVEVVETEHRRESRLTVDSARRDADTSSTITLSAGASSQRTNSETSSTPARCHARSRKPSHSNHNASEWAYARTVFGDRSIAARCARNRSAAATVTSSSSSTVHDSAPVTGMTSRCTRTARAFRPGPHGGRVDEVYTPDGATWWTSNTPSR
jgi:hypothetical protein